MTTMLCLLHVHEPDDWCRRCRCRGRLILHELAHLVGLAHVNDPRSMMYPEWTGRVTQYSVGDRIGLARLGRGSCEPRL